MAFVAREPTRKVHIVRILGTNKDGEVLQDIWLDSERIDVYRVSTKSPAGQFQGIRAAFTQARAVPGARQATETAPPSRGEAASSKSKSGSRCKTKNSRYE